MIYKVWNGVINIFCCTNCLTFSVVFSFQSCTACDGNATCEKAEGSKVYKPIWMARKMFICFIIWVNSCCERNVKVKNKRQRETEMARTMKVQRGQMGWPYILCAHQPLFRPPSPFSECCHDSTASWERLYWVGLYGKRDMCAGEVSPEVLRGMSPWVNLTHSWLHDSCFFEIRDVFWCEDPVRQVELSTTTLFTSLEVCWRVHGMSHCPTIHSTFTSQQPVNAWAECWLLGSHRVTE